MDSEYEGKQKQTPSRHLKTVLPARSVRLLDITQFVDYLSLRISGPWTMREDPQINSCDTKGEDGKVY